MLNKANKVMEQRQNLIDQAYEALKVLQAPVVNAEAVQTVVTINKGRIIEVVKEVKEDTTCFQETINKKDKYIAQLEQLVDERDTEITKLAAEVNKREHRITDLTNEITKLKAQLAAKENAAPKFIVEDDPMYNHVKEWMDEALNTTKETKEEKEVDELTRLKAEYDALNEQYKKAPNKELRNKGLALRKRIKELEEQQKNTVVEETNEIEILAKDEKNHALAGKVIINNIRYFFRQTCNHVNPIVYGAMDMATIEEAKRLINKSCDVTFLATNDKDIDDVIYDFDNKLVIWRTNEGQFKGYNDKYIFAWDGKAEAPARKLIDNALLNKPNLWKPMTKKATGSVAMQAEGERIMAACKQLFDEDATEDTNEIVVNVTNDNFRNTTNDEEDLLEGADDIEM